MDMWAKIRKEYIAGGTSYRKLAEKYGVSRSAIEARGRAEGWVADLRQKQGITKAKTVEALAAAESSVEMDVYDAAHELLEAFRESLRTAKDEGIIDAERIKDYGSGLRSIQMVMSSKPTKLDIQKKMAEIKVLQKNANRDEADHEGVEVKLEGVEDYAK